jgi:hypothetical protein
MVETQDPEAVRRAIEYERAELANAVERLRSNLDIGRKLGSRPSLVAPAAFAMAFVISGGIGATMRYLARRGREH